MVSGFCMVLAGWKSIPIKQEIIHCKTDCCALRERERGTELQTKVNTLGSSKERERKIECNRLDRGKGK